MGLLAAPTQGQQAADSATTTTSTTATSTTTLAARGRRADIGGTVFERRGESTRAAFERVRRTYGGKLGAIRVFFPGLPADWSKIRHNYGRTPLVISFKASPADIIAGRLDRRFRSWFAHAPTGRVTRWSFWHEPEDDAGLSAAKYRQAWRHLDALAERANNPKLRSALILMCWTLADSSGRDWRDWYAGPRSVNLFAFDCYNAGHRNGTYRSPRGLLEDAVRLSRRTGKGWAIAELGSVVVRGDDGRRRAAWLRDAVGYARNHGARFVTYFDSDVGVDYRLHDRPSKGAWRDVVRSQFR